MRWGCAVAAFAILLGNSYYYWRFLVRHQEAARMATLVEALEAKSTKKLKPATRQYMQRLYGPDVAQARDFFLDCNPYWKNIHKHYYLAAVSWLREGKTKEALKTLHQSLRYHPFFLNSYKLLWYIYDSLHLDGRAKACKTVYKGILSGEAMSHDVMCDCIKLEGCNERDFTAKHDCVIH